MKFPVVSIRMLAVAAPAVAAAVMLAAPSAPLQAQAAREDTVLPGYWEYTTSVLGQDDTQTRCVRPSEIDRFFGGLSTRRYRCTYPTRVVGGGNARFEGSCIGTKDGRRVRVRLNGPYAPESFTFRGGASIRAAGLWTPYIPATITARRLAAQCPAGAEYF